MQQELVNTRRKSATYTGSRIIVNDQASTAETTQHPLAGTRMSGADMVVQVLADELTTTTSIRVNCINPGATNTQMRRDAYPAEEPSTNPPPEQIMPLYLYLMGPESEGVCGQSLDAQS